MAAAARSGWSRSAARRCRATCTGPARHGTTGAPAPHGQRVHDCAEPRNGDARGRWAARAGCPAQLPTRASSSRRYGRCTWG
eukprot:2779761-Prymnesium_polylepis.1